MPTRDELLLGDIVVARGMVSAERLAEALRELDEPDRRCSLVSILLGRGFLAERDFEELAESHPGLVGGEHGGFVHGG